MTTKITTRRAFSVAMWTVLLLIGMLEVAKCSICPSQPTESSGESAAAASTTPAVSAVAAESCFDVQQFEYTPAKKAQKEKTTELECVVRNKGAADSVAWLHDGQLISLNDRIVKPDRALSLDTDGARKFNLRITHVDTAHRGTYKCQIIAATSKNLEYVLDVLVPPTISRLPSADVITVSAGESLTVQCLTQGNPRPRLTWSKTGEKAEHTTIDETRSTLSLVSVDESHADTYSCTAKNGVGNPVTSEFQVLVKFKPRVAVVEEENANKSVVYSAVGRKERIRCVVNAFPAPRMTLLFNDAPLASDAFTFETSKTSDREFELTYSFTAGADTFGEYACVADNELGTGSAAVRVTGLTGGVTLSNDKLPAYSDAALFEWSTLSGSPIRELRVQIFAAGSSGNETSSHSANGTLIESKTRPTLPDGSDAPPTYHNELVQYRDFYDLTKLQANSTYTVRVRVRNELPLPVPSAGADAATSADFGWSEWSNNLTVRTLPEESVLSQPADKLTKHRSYQLHHHRQQLHHHDRKHKSYAQQTGSRDLNAKRDRYDSFGFDKNNAATARGVQAVVLLACSAFAHHLLLL